MKGFIWIVIFMFLVIVFVLLRKFCFGMIVVICCVYVDLVGLILLVYSVIINIMIFIKFLLLIYMFIFIWLFWNMLDDWKLVNVVDFE